ncbi:glycoside hydrolase family 10 protein [Melittangium boletus]|uniref:glycoside hydrolase family 10 protein n=1 Tax=Melittangium boletus TaxID=83453 RepID=UPI0012FD4A3D|nr:family 10 glycosylhydrolase [Melittangium boletus]
MHKTLLTTGLLLLATACGELGERPFEPGAPTEVDAGVPDSGTPDSETPDSGVPEKVTVTHSRELRGVWVATVLRLDWPPSTTMTPAEGRASLDAMVDELAGLGFNALFFQVRPESDALYASTLDPWSRFLTGTQGTGPGWDPLEHLINVAHARGVEVHAWINPYRGLMSPSVVAAPGHVTKRLPEFAVTYNNAVVMNPGEPAVRQHVTAVVKDLLDHYDVDGLHFDDYFYPYPDSQNTPFPDDATYTRYQEGGGTLEKGDWRRNNVNTLVHEVMELISSEHPHVRFGISPIGLWKNGEPVSGFDAYNAIACDAVTWMKEGWIDYLAPQLYWRESSKQPYSTLSTWWANRPKGGVHVFPGHAVHNLSGELQNWPLTEIADQVAFTRTLRAQGAQGDLHFRARFILDDTKGVKGLLRDELYAQPALPPQVPREGAAMTPPVPFVVREGNTVHVTNPLPLDARFHLLYRETSPGTWTLERVVGGAQATFEVSSGTWAVSDVGRGGAESQGVRITVP